MDARNAKVLGRCGRNRAPLKRKLDSACIGNVVRPSKSHRSSGYVEAVTFHHAPEHKTSSNSLLGKQIIQGFQNFMSSAPPLQILWYLDGVWKDFPDNVVQIVQADFMEKRGIIEVFFLDRLLLLDFVHMLCICTKTGLESPLAWIDQLGKRYFPEMHSIESVLPALNRMDEISDCSEVSESIAESTNFEPYDEVASYGKEEKLDNVTVCSRRGDEDATGIVCKNESCTSNSTFPSMPGLVMKLSKAQDVGPAVENMLLHGMRSIIDRKDIIGVYRTPFFDCEGLGRFVPFQNMISHINNRRGNANVRYAWLACTRDAVDAMMLCGLLQIKRPAKCPSYGIGTVLAPANRSNVCASYCDTDENGIFHMMLCRVIMGSVEVVQSGSQQCGPSDERFDSGVDDLRNPHHYIIWDRNVSTHIYPEFVVTIKIRTETKGDDTSEKAEPCDVSVLPSLDMVAQDRSIQPLLPLPKEHQTPACKTTANIPSLPRMPFSMLFAALSARVKPEIMEHVYTFYEDFKNKRISRIELVKKMRIAVGDELMVPTILMLQEKLPTAVRRDLPSRVSQDGSSSI